MQLLILLATHGILWLEGVLETKQWEAVAQASKRFRVGPENMKELPEPANTQWTIYQTADLSREAIASGKGTSSALGILI